MLNCFNALRDFTSLNKYNKWTAAYLKLLLLTLTVKLHNDMYEFCLWLNVKEAWSNGFQNQLFTSIETRPAKEDLLPDSTWGLTTHFVFKLLIKYHAYHKGTGERFHRLKTIDLSEWSETRSSWVLHLNWNFLGKIQVFPIKLYVTRKRRSKQGFLFLLTSIPEACSFVNWLHLYEMIAGIWYFKG